MNATVLDLPDHVRKDMLNNSQNNLAHISLILASGGLNDEAYETIKSHQHSLLSMIALLQAR